MGTGVFDLTGFQRDLLLVISGLENPSGQDVKSELERHVDDITHARLYPNLDTLVDDGFVEKGQIDRRTNSYCVTEDGVAALEAYQRWGEKYLPDTPADAPQSNTVTTNRVDTTE